MAIGNVNLSVDELQNKNYEFFEKLILDLINKYKEHPDFENWYLAVGDNAQGRSDENFISIGMLDKNNKLNYSRIRIPKNELGKKLIEKFIRSVFAGGIESINIVKNQGENLNTVGYITTKDDKYFEVYTIKDDLIINGNKIDLDYLKKEKTEDYEVLEFDEINNKIDHINDMLNL